VILSSIISLVSSVYCSSVYLTGSTTGAEISSFSFRITSLTSGSSTFSSTFSSFSSDYIIASTISFSSITFLTSIFSSTFSS